MATIYGSFPGVQIEVAGGGITAVAIGAEEKLVLFGAADYQNDGTFPADGDEDPLVSGLTASGPESPETINARREADNTFGEGSELADAMREALANGANIDFLNGVAPQRFNVVAETQGSQSGTLNNAPIWEDDVDDEQNISNLVVRDNGGTDPDVFYHYGTGTSTAPPVPSASETVLVNPLTGEYNADGSPSGDYEFDYKWLDWNSAFTATAVRNVVKEEETAIYAAVEEADSVSVDLESEASNRRDVYQLVNAVMAAEPNFEQTVTSDGASLQSDYSNYQRRDARYDTANYSNASNQSIDADYFFKFSPVRKLDSSRTVLGGVGGLFSGNPIDDPIYNDELLGFDELEQSFTKTDADNMRVENVIPIRQNGSIRVKDNLSTSTETDWERDFWRRRIADRVILIGKVVGDQILGRINDPQTRNASARLIRAELRQLVNDRLLRPNEGDSQRWFVDVYEDSQNSNQVNIDIGFTPFGIVKRVNETVTIETN